MISSGYIHNRDCPQDPSHGEVLETETGFYCPHQTHTFPYETQSWWSEAEFVKLKTDQPPAPQNKAPEIRKRRKRRG